MSRDDEPKGIPPMSTEARIEMRFCNKALWEIRKRNMPIKVAHFAEAWACEMQSALESGASMHEVARQTAVHVFSTSSVDYEVLHQAVAQLNECWYWGEELFRWHQQQATVN